MTTARLGWRTYCTVGIVVAAVLVAMAVVSHHSKVVPSMVRNPATPASSAKPKPVALTFGVWGTPDEVEAYRTIVASYNRTTATARVSLKVYPSSDALATAALDPATAPNVYLLPRADLGRVLEADRNRPVQDMLADRGVNLGDDYSRDAVTAFSADDDLQCMPFTVSPMVMYYNTDLIHFERMGQRGLNVPNPSGTFFTLDEFHVAARVASRVHGGHAAGLAIDPTLQGLAPFVYSGGGNLFDDQNTPTRLALADGGAPNALRKTLEILRDPRLTLTDAQRRRKSALKWFEQGRLGLIAGFRDLVPKLRSVPGLHFDTLPMPSVGSSKTVGELTGACLAAHQPHEAEAAADLLTYLVGNDAMTVVAGTGSLQPADLRVAYSDAFLQPAQQPANAAVFNAMLRTIQVAPLDVPWTQLEHSVAPKLSALLYQQGDLGDLDQRLDVIDERSKAVLAPPPSPSATPSGTPSGAPSGRATSPAGTPTASPSR